MRNFERERHTEMWCSDLTDGDLIRELRRRSRLVLLDVNQLYYTELKDDEHYMASVNYQLVHHITRGLLDKKLVVTEEAKFAGPRLNQTGRRVTLLAITPPPTSFEPEIVQDARPGPKTAAGRRMVGADRCDPAPVPAPGGSADPLADPPVVRDSDLMYDEHGPAAPGDDHSKIDRSKPVFSQ